MEEQILYRYFKEKMKQVDIANELKISKYKVSRTITKDSRYKNEKEKRKAENTIKHIQDTKQYIAKTRRNKSNDIEYARLKNAHIQASRELSGGRKQMSNRTFRNCNTSIYQYNSKSESYVLKKNIITGADVPKKISWKIF